MQFALALFVSLFVTAVHGLRPQESETRIDHLLDGRWQLMLNPNDQISASQLHDAVTNGNFNLGQLVYDMPVPGSINDITMNITVRNYVGWSYMWRTFYLPGLLAKAEDLNRFYLRFDSVNYYCDVYLNGVLLVSHEGGHLPFEAGVTSLLSTSGVNTLIVKLNNTLNATTVPPAQYLHKSGKDYPANYTEQVLNMDFYNYAGIQRSVHLTTKPRIARVEDVHVNTIAVDVANHGALLNWTVQLDYDRATTVHLRLQLYDANNSLRSQFDVDTSSQVNSGQLKLTNVAFWWPRSLGIDTQGRLVLPPNGEPAGYLYTLVISVVANPGTAEVLLDRYRLKIGIRTVRLTGNALLINENPLYCTGVNMHEDADIRGRGFDMSILLRNFEALEWLGVNCVRTSHYPYAEDFFDMADKVGIAIFDEVPAVGLTQNENFVERTFQQHCRTIIDLVARDRNRASVIGWSLANEPDSTLPAAGDYFKSLFAFARAQDVNSGRPLIYTISGVDQLNTDRAAPFADITALNRYNAWYSDLAHVELIELQVTTEVRSWYAKYARPIMFTEFGAEAISGLHKWPPVAFSEEYQAELINKFQRSFDVLRSSGVPFIGELIWNFADFGTDQSISRVDGNHKGLLTRQRQPKLAAHVVRHRYRGLDAARFLHYSFPERFGIL